MATADVVVIGGGSAGYAAALRASELGRSVVVVERDRLGGTCLHRGCVPTKALLHVADVADVVAGAAAVGVQAGLGGIDPDAMHAFRRRIVEAKHKGLTGLVAARGITVVHGEGRLDGPGRVVVGTDVIEAKDVVLALGARTRPLPGVEFGDRVLSSDTALELAEIPDRVIVLGGGVIGVEFASLWRSLGAEVTIVEALPSLVPNEDESLRKGLERAFRKRGIGFRTGVRVTSVAPSADDVTVTLEDGSDLVADRVLVAIGRVPASDGWDEAGIALDRGFVVVDDRLRTSVPHVWAVGDLVAGPQLAHRGFQHGIFVAEQIAGLSPIPVPDHTIPRITYSHPELAAVGLTRAQAEERYGAAAIAVADYNLAGNARSEILGTSGSVRVVRRVDGPVVGVHLIGDRVGELISEAQLIVGWDAHPEDVAPFVHAHPTQSEALGEAMLALAGKPLHAL
ncbi:dihydrolipoyl dehydrogenase [Microbacterium sp. SORGH_AS_0888]|uniref:dihydrolipoyl dehydrogenase n=1 Tax=Microbacterium sp. SORGH_AS_0888 TaxID=3041791 RepID=UPI002781CDC5|nr:dihydrolipoyl dehydrogenase [Microbacterium sp. SORGH_AS_0888]MDQ1128587.1 dihydrolipoamide dehydrogenase [Microbacterium sp. SORGH_AS_0888]